MRPLTPTVALEHHRGVDGAGYPDLGEHAVPHFLSQIVSVADIYEAITGARSYQDPAAPEQACLILARLAGTKLNTALVKAFVNAISFFPLGIVVRTNRDELGVVIRTTHGEPLHPVIAPLSAGLRAPAGRRRHQCPRSHRRLRPPRHRDGHASPAARSEPALRCLNCVLRERPAEPTDMC